MKTRTVIVALICVASLVAGCEDQSSSGGGGGGGRTAAVPEYKPAGRQVPTPDLRAAGQTPQFKAAIATVQQLTGSAPTPLTNEVSDQPTGGVAFKAPHATVEKQLTNWHRQLLKQGAYLIRMDNSFGINGPNDLDDLALIPTSDKYVALAVMQTDGANYEIMTGDIIDWLKQMEQEQPFELTEAGLDYCGGNFTTPLKDPAALAARMYAFCPDIVDQGTGDVDKLAAELRKTGQFFFWWD